MLVALGILLVAGLAGGLTLAFRSPGNGNGGSVNGSSGAFNHLGAAQHAPAGANVLPPAILSAVEHGNAQVKVENAREAKSGSPARFFPERLDTAHLLARTPNATFYVLADTRGYLCSYEVTTPPVFSGDGCEPQLSHARPAMLDAGAGCLGSACSFIVDGVAMDGVKSVSFTFRGKHMSLPVENNVFTLKQRASAEAGAASSAPTAQCPVAHFASGSTVNLAGYPCRSGD